MFLFCSKNHLLCHISDELKAMKTQIQVTCARLVLRASISHTFTPKGTDSDLPRGLRRVREQGARSGAV